LKKNSKLELIFLAIKILQRWNGSGEGVGELGRWGDGVLDYLEW
jgi:hypothetical protein